MVATKLLKRDAVAPQTGIRALADGPAATYRRAARR